MKTKPNNILSLFSGMECLRIALDELGVNIGKYYASEIEPRPIELTKFLFPDIIHLGDVTRWREWDIDWQNIHFIGAGSPCQGFSFAGKQLAFDDPRSKLFFVFIEILNHAKKCNPEVKFLLENVLMKKEHQKVINDTLGLFPVKINSALQSAQNRERLYWTNIKTKQVGLFGELHTDITQPEDLGILLKDIVESEVDEKYYLSNKALEKLNLKGMDLNGKSRTQRESTGLCLNDKHNYQIIKCDKNGIPKKDEDKASCFTAGGNSGGNHSDMDLICVAVRGRENKNVACLSPKRTEHGKAIRTQYEKGLIKEKRKNIQQLEPRTDGKTNTLTSVDKDNYLLVDRSHKNEGIRYYKDKCPTLNARDYKEPRELYDGYRLRRLTPRECLRLQTVPESIIDKILSSGLKDSPIYKMAGNGWTIEIIKHILSFNNFNS